MARVFSAWDETIDRNGEPRHLTSPHLSPEPHWTDNTDGCETWLRQQNVDLGKIHVVCDSTSYTPSCYKNVIGLALDFWMETKGVWTIWCFIKSASNHSAPSTYLYALSELSLDHQIYFKNGGYQQCRITLCWISISLRKVLPGSVYHGLSLRASWPVLYGL